MSEYKLGKKYRAEQQDKVIKELQARLDNLTSSFPAVIKEAWLEGFNADGEDAEKAYLKSETGLMLAGTIECDHDSCEPRIILPNSANH